MTTLHSSPHRSRAASAPRVRPELVADGVVTSYIRDISVRRRDGAHAAAPTRPPADRLRERSRDRRQCNGRQSSHSIASLGALIRSCPPAAIPG